MGRKFEYTSRRELIAHFLTGEIGANCCHRGGCRIPEMRAKCYCWEAAGELERLLDNYTAEKTLAPSTKP